MPGGARSTSDRSLRRAFAPGRAVAALLLALIVLSTLTPILVGVNNALAHAPSSPPRHPPLSAPDALRFLRSLLVAGGIAALATSLALPAALALRRLPTFLAALAFAPLLLPSYLAYSAWGALRTPGTRIGSWLASVIAHDGPRYGPLANHLQAFLGLALWAWPLALIPVLLRARALDDDALLAAAQLSPSRARRTMLMLSALRAPIALGFALVVIVMMGSAVPLQLANVDTYAMAVWRQLELTAGARPAWITSIPLLALGLLAGIALGTMILRAPAADIAPRRAERAPHAWRAPASWVAMGVLALSTLFPAIVLGFALRERRSLALFWREAGYDFARSLAFAGVIALLAALLALLTSAALSGTRRSCARPVALITIIILLVLAFTPGVLLASAIVRASNTDATAFLADTVVGLALAHVARFGALGALAGWFLARSEPPPLRDARLLEDASLLGWTRTALRPQVPGFLAAGLAVGALSLHEVEAAALLAPPGLETFPRRMLSMLHYLRVEELTAAMLWTLTLGLFTSVLVAALSAFSARAFARSRVAAVAPLLMLALLLSACQRPPKPGEPIRVITQFGETGDNPGQFAYVRAIDVDAVHSPPTLWIADRTGRVQRFGLDGKVRAVFTLPEYELGKPVGMTVGPDGLLYVADTHYHRILIYQPDDSPEGATLIKQFGSYGTGPGQFIYPTDVAVLPSTTGNPDDARILVSEYGGNDRISFFTPDFTFLRSFGKEGSGATAESVEFQRPQSILYDPVRDRLFITDAGNHRLGVFTLEGRLERWIGATDPSLGAVPGDPILNQPDGAAFNFPYGLAPLDPDGGGDLLIVEYAACRVQRVDPDTGTTIATYGKPGRGPGELVQPWGLAVYDRIAYLLDSRNNRVVSFRP